MNTISSLLLLSMIMTLIIAIIVIIVINVTVIIEIVILRQHSSNLRFTNLREYIFLTSIFFSFLILRNNMNSTVLNNKSKISLKKRKISEMKKISAEFSSFRIFFV